MKFKFSLLYLVSTLALFGSFALKVNASTSTDILVNMVPANPAPYENTSITLNSYTEKLDSVLISWSIDGKVLASGTGKKSFTTNAPAQGGSTTVVATLYLPNNAIETKIIIKPSVMVLLWQATDSYVPPFYEGKALPTPDSEVKVVAMPEIKTGSGLVDPNNMTYAWKKDYTNNVDGSGYGKNSFLYSTDYLEDSNNVSVTASTTDQQFSSNASLDVGTTTPKILFYKNEKSSGAILENALTNPYNIKSSDIVQAVPYFISPKELLNPSLIWNWFINDSPVNLTGYRKDLMPLQVKEGTHGTSILKLEITNQDKLFESASKEINIEF